MSGMPFTTVVFLAGVLLFLVALQGRFSLRGATVGTDVKPLRWIAGVAGVTLGTTALAVSTFENSLAAPSAAASNPSMEERTARATAEQPQAVPPQTIVTIIREEQLRWVRKSIGEAASQCFTDQNLAEFKRNKVSARITAGLETNARFLSAVIALKALPASERSEILSTARLERRRTWEELGGINPDGQTRAGSEAEVIIANAVVDSALRLMQFPITALKRKGL
jgi:hypothetical protein